MTLTLVPPPGQTLKWLGGPIDIRVEVDTGAGEGFGGLWDEALWDTSKWGSEDPDWQDMTAYVLEVTFRDGTERWGSRFEASTGSIIVDNTTGIFTPGLDVDTPFTRVFRPGRRIRVVAIPDVETGEKQPLFTGRLDASPVDFTDGGYGVEATINMVDFMGDWAQFNPLAGTATGVQSTDARVTAALDKYEWPADERDIQTGIATMATADLAQTTLEECQRAADAEGGAFFCDRRGFAVFKKRDWLTTDTRSVNIQGYIGYEEVPDGAHAAHVIAVETSWELARVVNDARFAREGGTLQTWDDAASINAFGIRTYGRTDFHNATDGEVLALAVQYVNALKDLRMRVDSVAIAAVEDPDNEDLNRLFWDVRLGDRLAIKVPTPWGWELERDTHVFGMEHTITADDWTIRLLLDDAQTIELTYWILEDPEFGILNETTRLA